MKPIVKTYIQVTKKRFMAFHHQELMNGCAKKY